MPVILYYKLQIEQLLCKHPNGHASIPEFWVTVMFSSIKK